MIKRSIVHEKKREMLFCENALLEAKAKQSRKKNLRKW